MTDTNLTVVMARLAHDQDFLIKCVQLLYEKQELDEQEAQSTIHNNGIGFNRSDAIFLTGWLNNIKDDDEFNQQMAKSHTSTVARMMLKYSKQLLNYLTIEEIETL